MYIRMTLLVCFLFNYIIVINAFNPISLSTSDSSNSATHDSITRCAIATVTSEYFKTRFNINIAVPTINNGTCPSTFYSLIQNAFSTIANLGGNTYLNWLLSVDYIISRNVLVDVAEQFDESRHFDSESFIPASQIILDRYNLAVQALNKSDFENANENFGKMTHTLQDFYSHSNWIEMNQRQPQPDIGIRALIAAQFAGPKTRTCNNCATGPDAVCQSNTLIQSLTSGYFVFRIDYKHKPAGKCSHGGSSDASRDEDAIGGINKDTIESIHGYLHQPAAQTAYLATCKILRQFRTQVQDTAFGQFLNILIRPKKTTRSLLSSILKGLNLDPALIYTNILNNVRNADSSTRIQQIVSLPSIDSDYKAHVLSIALHKRITIDILRNLMYLQNYFDYGQDLARYTGGLFLYYYSNQNQDSNIIKTNDQTELIQFFYSKNPSNNNIVFTIDNTCSDILLEFVTNDTISSLAIQLKNSNQLLSPSSIVTDTKYYKSYLFSNISSGNWQLILTTSTKFTFNLRISCSSKFRCFSRLYVNNDNSIHPGVVELEGNLIQNKDAYLITTCDNNNIPIINMTITMVDEINGNLLGNSFQSNFDSSNNQWITNLTNIPTKSFRLKYLINNQQIQRLSPIVYQPSLIDVEMIQVNTTSITKTLIKYRLYNYRQTSVPITFVAKNIGTYSKTKIYLLKTNEIRDDEIEFDQNTKASDMNGNMITLTVKASDTDWNYDVITI